MEVGTKVSYSLVDKYFKVIPEGRINRKQFLIRVLMMLTIYTLFYYIISYGFTLLNELIIDGYSEDIGDKMFLIGRLFIYNNFIALSLILLVYKPITSLTKKRINDIGNNGKVLFNMIRIVFGYPILLFIIYSISFLAIPYIILIGMMMGYGIVGSITIILLLILIIRKGKSGDNEYGKDPNNTKVSFLG